MRLIDAERLYSTIVDEIDPISISMDGGEMRGMMRTIIAAEPTIEATPVRHGRWEYIPGDGKFRAILICSRCRRNVGEYNRFNYCPHCGAKMDL